MNAQEQDETRFQSKTHEMGRQRVIAAVNELDSASAFGPVRPNASDTALRLFYLKADVITMTQVLLNLDEVLASSVSALESDGAPSKTVVLRWKSASPAVFPQINRLAVSYKALFFFLRAFQDLAYATLLELSGQPTGSYTSMTSCFAPLKPGRSSNNAIRVQIGSSLPKYEMWFKSFRKLRDDFKFGRGHGLDTCDGCVKVAIDLQRGNICQRKVLVGLDDLATCLEMSAGLFRVMKQFAVTTPVKLGG